MKKYFLLGLMVALAPNMCLGESARYTQLVREKQRKMEELEKCMGATKGLKIAGISTLGLTAVGVAGNIVEAKKRNEYDADIKKADKKISGAQQEIEKVDDAINQKNAEIEQQRLQEQQLQLQQQQPQVVSVVQIEQQGTPQEQPKAVSDDVFTKNCKDSGGMPSGYGTCFCQYGFTADATGNCVVNFGKNSNNGNNGNNADDTPKAATDDAFTKNCKDSGGTPSGYGTCFCPYGFTADATGKCVVSFGKSSNNGNAGNDDPKPAATNTTQEDAFTKNCKDSGGTPSGYGTCNCQYGFTSDATGKCVKNFGSNPTTGNNNDTKPAATTPTNTTTNTGGNNGGTSQPTVNKGYHQPCTEEDLAPLKVKGATEGWYYNGKCVAKTCDESNGWTLATNSSGVSQGYCTKKTTTSGGSGNNNKPASNSGNTNTGNTNTGATNTGNTNTGGTNGIQPQNLSFQSPYPIMPADNTRVVKNLPSPQAGAVFGNCSKNLVDVGYVCKCIFANYSKNYSTDTACYQKCNDYCKTAGSSETTYRPAK